ncbi:MAG TPA: Hsp20/alpha crystallin family protein [Candidatus Polarisedimenticolaceae bacterium]|nr:Hsp20/alpha crystallin family protein [Candidatus Polarisedimenticolaceae bacterium]
MNVIRWYPYGDLFAFGDRVQRALLGVDRPAQAWLPAADVYEQDDALVVRLDLPGVDKDQIDVQAENGALVVRGERRHASETDEHDALQLERVHGVFTRRFQLPRTVDASQISAAYKNGVLELRLPKSDAAKARRIEIQAA